MEYIRIFDLCLIHPNLCMMIFCLFITCFSIFLFCSVTLTMEAVVQWRYPTHPIFPYEIIVFELNILIFIYFFV